MVAGFLAEIFDGKSGGPFPPELAMPRNFWPPHIGLKVTSAMSASPGNRANMRASGRGETRGVAFAENPAYSRIDARWAACRTSGCPWMSIRRMPSWSVLCPVVELFSWKSELGHVLAGHALALEHEILAEGRRGRLVSGLRSAVQRPKTRRSSPVSIAIRSSFVASRPATIAFTPKRPAVRATCSPT